MSRKHSLDTKLVHAGEPSPRIAGAVNMPVVQSSTFLTEDDEDGYHDVRYIRLNNTPNHVVLHDKIASLEGAEAGLVAASGMAIITTTLLTFLSRGDHVLAQDSLYGGTFDFITEELPRLGISCGLVDSGDPSTWPSKVRPETKLFYVEGISNPLMHACDVASVVEFARSRDLKLVIDNTFATPVNFRPIEHGFDVCLHSGTKYLNGHTDIVCGVASGRAEWIDAIKTKLAYYGGTLDPHACFLLHRGLKTLGLRVRKQNENALALASALAAHDGVDRVLYPGLASHPSHEKARSTFAGFGGMLSIELNGGRDAALKLIDELELAIYAPSLGGVETLVTFPAMTSHAGMSPEDRQRIGITDGLVRVSVGIEDADDLIADFARALDRAKVESNR